MTNGTDHPQAARASVIALELVDGPCDFLSFGDLISTIEKHLRRQYSGRAQD
jgi:hypothetical protein